MNRLPPRLSVGTLAELLVQLRLLEYGVQAAPPIKDSGNDLIAVFGNVFKAIQVKATTGRRRSVHFNRLPAQYHLLAFVQFLPPQPLLQLDEATIYLLSRREIENESNLRSDWQAYLLSAGRIEELFA